MYAHVQWCIHVQACRCPLFTGGWGSLKGSIGGAGRCLHSLAPSSRMSRMTSCMKAWICLRPSRSCRDVKDIRACDCLENQALSPQSSQHELIVQLSLIWPPLNLNLWRIDVVGHLGGFPGLFGSILDILNALTKKTYQTLKGTFLEAPGKGSNAQDGQKACGFCRVLVCSCGLFVPLFLCHVKPPECSPSG